MNLSRVAQAFGSGCLVYFAMAACTAEMASVPSHADSPVPSDTSEPGATPPTAKQTKTPTSSVTPVPSATVPSPVPNAMAEESHKAGTRLKLQYWEADDGAKQFAGWYDSQLKVTCAFGKTEGGMKCLPFGDDITSFPSTGFFAFSDASCTTPLVFTLKTAAVPKYALTADAKVYPLVPYTGDVYGSTTGTSCGGPGVGGGYTRNFYSLGTQMSSTALVSATLKTSE